MLLDLGYCLMVHGNLSRENDRNQQVFSRSLNDTRKPDVADPQGSPTPSASTRGPSALMVGQIVRKRATYRKYVKRLDEAEVRVQALGRNKKRAVMPKED